MEEHEFLNETIDKRNYRLQKFFLSKGIDVKIVGDKNSPAIIINDEYCLSCYVKNFNLFFQDKPFKGQKLFQVKLTEDIDCTKDSKIRDWLENSEHRKIFKIRADVHNEPTTLYLSGFNKDEFFELKPVFCEVNPRIYFTYEKALSIVNKYSTENVPLIII